MKAEFEARYKDSNGEVLEVSKRMIVRNRCPSVRKSRLRVCADTRAVTMQQLMLYARRYLRAVPELTRELDVCTCPACISHRSGERVRWADVAQAAPGVHALSRLLYCDFAARRPLAFPGCDGPETANLCCVDDRCRSARCGLKRMQLKSCPTVANYDRKMVLFEYVKSEQKNQKLLFLCRSRSPSLSRDGGSRLATASFTTGTDAG